MNLKCDYAVPLLAIDQVLEMDGEKIRTRKNLSGDETFFAGHYPGNPIFPGNFILEAVHQATRYYVVHFLKLTAWAHLTRLESIRFFSPLYPGDQLEVVCRYQHQPEHPALFVQAECFHSMNNRAAKMKLFYTLCE